MTYSSQALRFSEHFFFAVAFVEVADSVSKHGLEGSLVFTSLISHVPFANWQPSGGAITPASTPYLNYQLELFRKTEVCYIPTTG